MAYWALSTLPSPLWDSMLSTIIVLLFTISAPLAHPLQITPSQLLTNTSFSELFTIQPTLNITTTNVTSPSFIGCFYQSNPPILLATTETDCEGALDEWVSGQDLYESRLFSRRSYYLVHDIKLPLVRQYGTCVIQLDVQSEDEEEMMSLEDVYTGIMGPDGLVKRCLGLQNPEQLGGMMTLGPKRKLLAVISGREMRMGGESS